jgi:hypothetical protein
MTQHPTSPALSERQCRSVPVCVWIAHAKGLRVHDPPILFSRRYCSSPCPASRTSHIHTVLDPRNVLPRRALCTSLWMKRPLAHPHPHPRTTRTHTSCTPSPSPSSHAASLSLPLAPSDTHHSRTPPTLFTPRPTHAPTIYPPSPSCAGYPSPHTPHATPRPSPRNAHLAHSHRPCIHLASGTRTCTCTPSPTRAHLAPALLLLPLTKTKTASASYSLLLPPLSSQKKQRKKESKKLSKKARKKTLKKRKQKRKKHSKGNKRTLSALNAIFPPAALSTSAML